jgi:HEAT repeat protein
MNTLPAEDGGREAAFAESLRNLLVQTASKNMRIRIQETLSIDPERFFLAGLSLLRSEANPDARRKIYAALVDCPDFLLQVAHPDRSSREDALAACRDLMHIDRFFDLRLARLIPRRYLEDSACDVPLIARVLDILNEISSGSRLILLLIPLARHPNPQIASKAALFTASRVQNNQFVERNLASRDARVRANVVEALWGVRTPLARRALHAALSDQNCRVVGNALFGLHLLGEESVIRRVESMLTDDRPELRRTAAWVMGQIGKPEFREHLQRALQDHQPGVRQAVRRALKTIRQAILSTQPPPAEIAGGPETAADAECPSPEAAVEVYKRHAGQPKSVPETPKQADGKSDKLHIRLDGKFVTSRRY